MRKYLLLAVLSVITFTTVQAQDEKEKSNKPRIEGSGNVVTKDINVQGLKMPRT